MSKFVTNTIIQIKNKIYYKTKTTLVSLNQNKKAIKYSKFKLNESLYNHIWEKYLQVNSDSIITIIFLKLLYFQPPRPAVFILKQWLKWEKC